MKGRRGGAGDLRSALGSLLRSTVEQMGAVKETLERQAQAQKVRLDAALLGRKRREALAELGRVAYDLAAQGRLGDLEDLPELGRALVAVEELDQEIENV